MTETASVAVDYRPRGSGRRNKSKAERDAEAVRAFEMRAAGYSTWEIARELDISVQTACTRIEAARKVLVPQQVEAAREQSMRTLEVAKRKLLADWSRLQQSADQANGPGKGKIEHSPKFAEALAKLEAAQAQLMGWNRPVQVEQKITITHEGGVDQELYDLAAELGLNDPITEKEPTA